MTTALTNVQTLRFLKALAHLDITSAKGVISENRDFTLIELSEILEANLFVKEIRDDRFATMMSLEDILEDVTKK